MHSITSAGWLPTKVTEMVDHNDIKSENGSNKESDPDGMNYPAVLQQPCWDICTNFCMLLRGKGRGEFLSEARS